MIQVDFPFHVGTDGATALVGDDGHVRDMIEQLLFTSAGERVNRPDFGSGVLRLVFEPNSPELATALQFTTQAALQRWLGDVIEVRRLAVSSEEATLRIVVEYLVRRTGELRTDTFEAAAR